MVIFLYNLKKFQIFLTKLAVTFFSEYFWKKFFTFLESMNLPLCRKYKMSSTFFHFGEKFLFKNVPPKQNDTFFKSFPTEKQCVSIKN